LDNCRVKSVLTQVKSSQLKLRLGQFEPRFSQVILGSSQSELVNLN